MESKKRAYKNNTNFIINTNRFSLYKYKQAQTKVVYIKQSDELYRKVQNYLHVEI